MGKMMQLGHHVGIFLGAVLRGVQTSLVNPVPPPPPPPTKAKEDVFMVSVCDSDVLGDVSRMHIQAATAESAAEKRVAILAEALYAAGHHRNRTFQCMVESGNGEQANWNVGVANYLKCEVIRAGASGSTWGK